ncbi:MAG: hypothetical protein ACTSWI_06795 [Alphaproteobacteria bacterium]
MFRKPVTLLALVGIAAAVLPQSASAQLQLPQFGAAGMIAQNALICLAQAQGAAVLAQNPEMALTLVLQRAGIALAQVVGIPCLATLDGRYVWEIWADTGGGPTRRVIDALPVRVQ